MDKVGVDGMLEETSNAMEMEFDEDSPFAETIKNLKRERDEVQHGTYPVFCFFILLI